MKLVLAGYFGCGNLGDDAVLLGFLEGLSAQHEVIVLSGSPEETYRLYKTRSAPRMDMNAVKQAIEESDALVFPGGSILQDVTSIRSVAYYGHLIKVAKRANKKVVMLAQGLGPLTKFLGKRMAVTALNSVDLLTVRDPGSAALCKTIGVRHNPRVTADMAFLLSTPPSNEDSTSFQVGNMRTVGIAPRPFGKDKKVVVQLFGDLCRLLFKANLMPVLIEMDRNMDGALILEIEKHQGGKVPDLRKTDTPVQLQRRLARMDAVIGVRLHAGILAATVGVPSLMVSYDPKVAAFAKQLGVAGALDPNGLTAQRLFENFQDMLKQRDQHVKTLQRAREELREQAKMNLTLMEECLNTAVRA